MRNTHPEQMFSALPSKADSCRTSRHDRFVPNPDTCELSNDCHGVRGRCRAGPWSGVVYRFGFRRTSYDYFMLTCGPISAKSQTLAPDGAVSMIADDGGLIASAPLSESELLGSPGAAA